jgi:hypothetical protein
MTEGHVTSRLIRTRWQKSFCLPNYTPAGWWECDVFELTRSGYFREYEVKLSRSDFFHDASKSKDSRDGIFTTAGWQPNRSDNKHDLLADQCERGPVEFFYVTPKGMIDRNEVPAWAGLIEISEHPESTHPLFRLVPHLVIKAPRLHRVPANPKIRTHAESVCYYRMHNLIQKVV